MSEYNLRDLFEELVNLNKADRTDRLIEIYDQNKEVHQRLIELLAFDDVPISLPESIGQAITDQGLKIGSYRIISLINNGPISQIYLAESLGDECERVAIKVLQPNKNDAGSATRFLRECEALHRIDHPSVVKMLEFGWFTQDTSDHPYIVMELVEGTRLTDFIDNHTPLLDEKLNLIRALADGLQQIHLNHIVHRDLKPSNIMIDENRKPKIIDFGVALVHSDTDEKLDFHTLTGQISGTPRYMSPEQIMGEHIDARSDIYSLGVVAYEMICGTHPHYQSRIPITRLSEVVCNSLPAPLSKHCKEAKGALSLVIGKCLEKRPDRRYTSAEALETDLNYVQLGLPVNSDGFLNLSRMMQYSLRHPRLTKAIGLAMLIAFSSAIAFGIRSNQLLRTSQRLSQFETANTDSADLLRLLLAGGFSNGEPVHTENHLVLLDKLLINIDQAQISDIARAQARGAIAEGYGMIKEFERALELYPTIIQEHEHVFGSADRRTILQMLRYAKKLQKAGFSERASAIMSDCLVRSSSLKNDPDLVGRLHYAFGEIQFGRKQFDDSLSSFKNAETLLAEAIDSREARLLHIYAMYGVAISYQELGELDLALAQLARLFSISEERFGPEDRRTVTARKKISEIQDAIQQDDGNLITDP